MRFGAPARFMPCAAMAATLVLGLTGHALAEDAKPPVIEEVTPPTAGDAAAPATGDAAQPPAGDASTVAKETNKCFTGEGSIKEVLADCATYIASNPTDKQRL